MSKEALLDAYLRGEISRRRFIHGLVGAGVSLAAATAYSGLVPQRALAAGGSYDLSDETESSGSTPPPPPPKARPAAGAHHKPPVLTLEASRRGRRVRVKVSCDEAADVVVSIVSGSSAIATKSLHLRAAAVKTLRFKLAKGAPAELKAVAKATDSAGAPSSARATIG
jgi:hypothetical protein